MNKLTIQTIILFIFCLLCSPFAGHSQVEFETGYFIDNAGEKTECLIKNYGWKNSPIRIEYKTSENSPVQILTIDNFREFQVANYKYQKYIVDIDQSDRALENLSEVKEPLFKRDTVFLRLLIEGYANLYFYGNRELYFFNVNSSDVSQLIFKEYIFKNRVTANETYKSQIWETLKCEDFTVKDVTAIRYVSSDLIRFFKKFNECKGEAYNAYDLHQKRDAFNLFVFAGARKANVKTSNPLNTTQGIDYPTELSLTFGMDIEFIAPFNRNKWAFIIRPVYQSYKAENPLRHYNNDVDYQSAEISPGIKYSMFLTNDLKLFLTGTVLLLDLDFNSSIGNLTIGKNSNNLNFGIGCAFKNRFSAEVVYGMNREILGDYVHASGSYQSVSFVIGFALF